MYPQIKALQNVARSSAVAMRGRVVLGGLAAAATLFFVVLSRQQVALPQPDDYHAADTSTYRGSTIEGYKGWKLMDDEFQTRVDPEKARIVFYIMVAGFKELPGLDALLRNLYHVEHFFLVHLDIKAQPAVRADVKDRIQRVLKGRGNGERNIRLVEPATPITWGGFTMTLNAVYGLTQALHWTTKWDYFINLSASDLPLLRTDEIAVILGQHRAANTSFIKGFKYEPSWEGYKFVDRREMFSEDEALMREITEKRWAWAILDEQKQMLTRPMPNLFTVYKGEFWVMLHRSMAEYVHRSPDNQARVLLTYFSGMMVSDEEFFQTVACNPHFPHDTLRTHDDNLRFVNWWGDQASPAIVPPFRAVAAANSGSLFGRKFSSSTEEGRDGIRWLETYLADSSRSKARVDRVKRRLAARMGPRGEPVGFCGKAQEKRPPEPYFAVEGEEEKLPAELQPRPHRRGGSHVTRSGEREGEGEGEGEEDWSGHRAVEEDGAAAVAAGSAAGERVRGRRLAYDSLFEPLGGKVEGAGRAGEGTGGEAGPQENEGWRHSGGTNRALDTRALPWASLLQENDGSGAAVHAQQWRRRRRRGDQDGAGRYGHGRSIADTEKIGMTLEE